MLSPHRENPDVETSTAEYARRFAGTSRAVVPGGPELAYGGRPRGASGGYPDRAFDAVICYRLMAHSIDWHRLVGELCRVSAHRVVLDYPARRSMNILPSVCFSIKRTVE